MRRNDLLFGIGLSFACYMIAPDVFSKAETVCFQLGMVIFGTFVSGLVRDALAEIKEQREALNISRRKAQRERRQNMNVNIPWKKRYYILPIEERY